MVWVFLIFALGALHAAPPCPRTSDVLTHAGVRGQVDVDHPEPWT